MFSYGNYRVIVAKETAESFGVVLTGPSHSGSGNIIARYDNYETAKAKSELFFKNFVSALEQGYHLNTRVFLHEDGRKVHVSNAIQNDRDFESLLQNGEQLD
ncbi:hypothetical protein [Paenibacillus sp. Pae108]|uniref:hypothetical protein n=1 Tax=Paenibacillus sp. Pae108 TaxID=2926019 RepID=UPI002118E037|nr:hypothetical protein [Paenibacillus sp. Pae108]